jgi:3D (Asp-Asp-Asp) domain-containing protein
MKYLLLIFAASSVLTSPALAREQSLLARVTVYWASGGAGSDACTREHKCSTGARLRSGHCAVDPKKIPYGSKVVFPDVTCVAVDTGRDVINRKAARRCGQTTAQRNALVIDRFFETKGQALRWAKANPHFMTVRVLIPNEQWAENKKSIPIIRQGSQTIAQKDSQPVAKQNAALPRPQSVATSPLGDPPNNKLLADNNHAGFQLPRRL